MNRLSPVSEEPINEAEKDSSSLLSSSLRSNCSKKVQTWRKWIRSHFPSLFFNKKSDLRILLSVMGCPLFPVSVHPQQRYLSHAVSSSAQYIIEHFRAATGCSRLENSGKSTYATGKVTMQVVDEIGSSDGPKNGCFVIWQMVPEKWLIEIVVGGQKVVAGSDGSVAWRHTPWLGSHAAKGGVRPLRRAMQGLDPVAISSAFASAQYVGEKPSPSASDDVCFVLKLLAEQADLSERSDNTSETIKHVTVGYFSQKTGLLVYLEDSYLTRVQSPGSRPAYWETTMCTRVGDYRPVDEARRLVKIAHSGESSAVITRFGDDLRGAVGAGITRMEERYLIEDMDFDVPGLSVDSFLPPREVGQARESDCFDR